MQAVQYIIDLDGVRDPELITDYFLSRVYGSSCFLRNIALLRRSFADICVSIVAADDILPSLAVDKLEMLAKRNGFSITVGGRLGPMPHEKSWSLVVLYQSGLSLITKLTEGGASGFDSVGTCACDRSCGSPSLLLEHCRRISAGGEGQVLLCHVFLADRDHKAGFTLYRKQDALHIDPNELELVKRVKIYLEKRASERSMDGPVSRLIIRRLCHLASKPLSAAGVHPNYVTLAGALFAFFAVLFFADGRGSLLAIGGICWLIGGILDEADGEVARLQGKESAFGSWLDLTLDRILDAAMLLSLAWPLILSRNGDEYLTLTLCSLVAVSASSYTGLLYDAWMRSKDKHAYFRLGRDIRILIITISALLGFRMLPIVLCGVFAAIEICRRFWVCWYVEKSGRLV